MKVIRNIIIAYTIVMGIILAVLFIRVGNVSLKRRDVSYYNDQLQQIYDRFSAGSVEDDIEREFGCSILLEPYSSTELYQAYQNSSLVMDFSQTIDIFVLKYGISKQQYGVATAAGMFKSIVAIILLFTANTLAKKLDESTLI